MNKKIQSLYRDVLRLSLALPVLFTLISLFFDKKLAIAGAAGTLLYLVWLLITERHRREGVDKVLETASFRADTALNRTLQGFPMPMAAFILSDGAVTWANEDFWQLCAAEERRQRCTSPSCFPICLSAGWRKGRIVCPSCWS